MTIDARPALVSLLVVGLMTGCSAAEALFGSPTPTGTTIAADIASCGPDSLFRDVFSRNSANGAAGDVTVVYDASFTAVDPACAQEWTTASSGKKTWLYYYPGGKDVVTSLETALVTTGWIMRSDDYLVRSEQDGNVRSTHLYAIPAADAPIEGPSWLSYGVPGTLADTDVVIVAID